MKYNAAGDALVKSGFAFGVFAVYSPDDGGYYAEICDEDGVNIHTTGIVDSIAKARSDARKWCTARDDTRVVVNLN